MRARAIDGEETLIQILLGYISFNRAVSLSLSLFTRRFEFLNFFEFFEFFEFLVQNRKMQIIENIIIIPRPYQVFVINILGTYFERLLYAKRIKTITDREDDEI